MLGQTAAKGNASKSQSFVERSLHFLTVVNAAGAMTAQRYLMVLLNLAHHHNILPPERREPTISDTDFVLRCASGAGPSCVELSLSAITFVDG
ncbi:unnamed protein product [Closterium sp. NIES-54]